MENKRFFSAAMHVFFPREEQDEKKYTRNKT